VTALGSGFIATETARAGRETGVSTQNTTETITETDTLVNWGITQQYTQELDVDFVNPYNQNAYISIDDEERSNFTATDPHFSWVIPNHQYVTTDRDFDEIYLRFETKHGTLRDSGDLRAVFSPDATEMREGGTWWTPRLEKEDASGSFEGHTVTVDDGSYGVEFVADTQVGHTGILTFVQTVEKKLSTSDWRIQDVTLHVPKADDGPDQVSDVGILTSEEDITLSLDELQYVEEAHLQFDYELKAGVNSLEVTVGESGPIVFGLPDQESGTVERTIRPEEFVSEDTLSLKFHPDGVFDDGMSGGGKYRIQNVTLEWLINKQNLEVDSSPNGATVEIDGQSVGTTAHTESLSPVEQYDVRVNKDGYQPVTRASVSPPASLDVDLELIQESLSVDSTPEGATILLDGNQIGTTPWSGDRPVTESYDIRIEKDGYESEQITDVSPGNSVSRELTPVTDTIRVDSDPEGATVYLNDNQVGSTPWSEERHVLDSYDIRIEKDGYDAVTQSGVSPPASIAPELNAQQGTLSVNTFPDGATVYLNGSQVGTSPWSGDRPVTESYDIRLEKDGYNTVTRSGVIPPSTVDVSLDSQQGTLSIDTTPDGATVYLDGNQVGTTPWSGDRSVTESYDVRVEKDGYDSITRNGVNPPNSLDLDLNTQQETLSVDSDPEGAMVYLNGNQVGTTPWSGDRPVTESYDIRLEKDGHETITRSGVSAPDSISVTLPAAEADITDRYDTNSDPGIQIAELNDAIDDYFTDNLSIQQLNTLIDAYFQQQ